MAWLRSQLRSTNRWTAVAWTAIVVGGGVRAGWVFGVHPPLDYVYSDMQGYVERAVRLASGSPLVRYDAFYPPGTHLLLAIPLKLFGHGRSGLWGAATIWWALSSLTPLFGWRLCRLLISPRAAALTAVFLSLYPLHVFYAGFFSSETPALALLAAALWLGYRARVVGDRGAAAVAVAAGASAAAAVAVRPQFLLNFAVLIVPAVVHWRTEWKMAGALVATGLAGLALVMAYNSAAAGRLTGISENGGMVFYQGQCDVHLVTAGNRELGVVSFGNPVAFRLKRGRDAYFPHHQGWDQGFFYGQGLDCARRDGLGHVKRLGRNLLDMTATTPPWPLPDKGSYGAITKATNVIYSLALLPIVLGSIALFVLRRRRGLGTGGVRDLLLHLGCAIPVALVFSSEPRYRVPYDLFGLALLGMLLTEVPRIKGRGRPKPPPLDAAVG